MSSQLHFPGNERVRRQLERALNSGRLAQSYLFEGAPGAGQEQAAVELAAGFIVGDTSLEHPDARRVRRFSHPDLNYLLPVLKPSGKSWGDHSREELLGLFREQQGKKTEDPFYLPQFTRQPHMPIEAVRLVLGVLATKPFEGRGRVMIIRDVDQMRTDAQDTLLKSLEEPPRGSLIILISQRPEALRPTVLSRCQRIPFEPMTAMEIETVLTDRAISAEQAGFIATLAEGNLERAVQFANAESEDGNTLLDQREENFKLLDRCEFGSDLEMMDAVSELLKRGKKDRSDNPVRARGEFLSQAISWYRELMRLSVESDEAGGASSLRVHVDQGERLARYRKLPAMALTGRIHGCEKARRQILSYINAELTLLTLFFSFRGARTRAS